MNRTQSKYSKIVLFVIGSLFFAQPVVTLAQSNGSVLSLQEREQRQLNALNDRLVLSSHQQKQVRQVLVERDAALAALRNDSSLAPEIKYAQMADIAQASKLKIRALLTTDQQPLYDDLLAEQQQDRDQARGTATVASQHTSPAPGATGTAAF